MKRESGITLIALVITIIVLLILASVTINLTLGDNGIFKVAEQAARNYKEAEEKELGLLEQFETELGTNFEYDATKGVNKPKVLTGMTPIKFNFNTTKNEYEEVDTSEIDENWYDYHNKQWANTQTEDGSMWVWIPRYAYRINYTYVSDKSAGGTVDVVFLIGTTDEYYDEKGNIKTAKRAKSADEIVDTTDYTVHPAFTDESSISYVNGGWDEELTGIWVAKFEAAYATNMNVVASKINVPSIVNYTQTQVYVPAVETKDTDKYVTARNHVDGEYGSTVTAIKYPTFQGVSYAMNYIGMNDAFNISRALTNTGNIYGLEESNADSHLIKNSEWGAIAYLSKSKYGLNATNIFINNVNLNNSTSSVYAVTGCCALTEDADAVTTTITEINARTATNLYVWSQEKGQQASTTGTVYGVYDMSGGTWERTAGYVANEHKYLKTYGASVTYNENTLKTVSTKYTTVYLHDTTVDNTSTSSTEENVTVAVQANYLKNTKIYGDAVRETSTEGVGAKSWNNDYSSFWGLNNPFSGRGGHWNNGSGAGVTASSRASGSPHYWDGFRSVLVAK